MTKVTLNVRTEPYEQDCGMGFTAYGKKVIGEVKCGDEILHTEEIIADDKEEPVRRATEDMAIKIEIWAVENTDFMPA